MIPAAYEALTEHLAKDGKIDKAYRGAMSSFGAAVVMGSILSAAAYYNDPDPDGKKAPGEIVDKNRVSLVLYDTLKRSEYGREITEKNLFDYVVKCCKNGNAQRVRCKELICDAAVAVKLAMNLFILV